MTKVKLILIILSATILAVAFIGSIAYIIYSKITYSEKRLQAARITLIISTVIVIAIIVTGIATDLWSA